MKHLFDIPNLVILPTFNNPYEDLAEFNHHSSLYLFFVKIFSGHNRDIFLLLASLLACSIALSVSLYYYIQDGTLTGMQIIFGMTVLGIFVAIMLQLVDVSQKRSAVVDLFIGEIISTTRILVIHDVVSRLVQMYNMIERSEKHGSVIMSEFGLNDDRKSMFETNCASIGFISSIVIENIVAFYTFSRSARDAAGAFGRWGDEDYPDAAKKNDIVRTAHGCLLMSIHGRKAIEQLIENEQRLDYASAYFRTIELQCFLLLERTLDKADPRMVRLRPRADRYHEMKKLSPSVSSPDPSGGVRPIQNPQVGVERRSRDGL